MTIGNAAHVAIVGAGFSGTLQAINLLRHGGPRATLIERRDDHLARGVAYSACHPLHLLNVRAANMSALPDDPDHFVRWLAARGAGGAGSFASRAVYGSYLAELLDAARQAGGDRLTIVRGEATDLVEDGQGVRIRLADGGRIDADAAVLALGNLPPHAPPGLAVERLPQDVYAGDPWASDIADGLGDGDRVLLLGTGLTAIDAALLLDARGFGGIMIAMSRRGLVPRPHRPAARRAPERLERPPAMLSRLVADVRGRAETLGWRDAVDELRPMTQAMWQGAGAAERGRFLRHLRPYWDVHRHRLAPEVAGRIDALRAAGRLRFIAGKTQAVTAAGDGAALDWRPRGGSATERMPVRRIVNCTGPQGDLLRSTEPLLVNLLAAGRIRADVLRLGLDVDSQSRAVDGGGRVSDRLFAIGPMTRGGYWEIVAVPDLRMQTWALARRFANAHWVGGEGL